MMDKYINEVEEYESKHLDCGLLSDKFIDEEEHKREYK